MKLRPAAALLLALAAACDRASTAPSDALSAAEAAHLAAQLDQVGTSFSSGLFLAPDVRPNMDVVSTTYNFQRTQPCPSGGTVAVSGSLTTKVDAAARSGGYALTATSAAACVLPRKDGGTFTLTGAPGTTVTAAQSFTAGTPGPLTATQKGSFTWTSDGRTGTCSVDLASTFDPATRVSNVKGTFCGVAVDATRTRG